MSMQNLDPNDTTKPLPDVSFGKWESDPSDQFIQRYVPAPDELVRLNELYKAEYEQAWNDDQKPREAKLALLKAYKGIPDGKDQIQIIPLIRRAVKQNVAWLKNTIMSRRPLVTVTPDSNSTIEVLVNDPTFGPVSLKKTSEEVASAIEGWLEYKLRKRLPFDRIVETAALEAKRGQTPTWIKITHDPAKRTVKSPKFGKNGPISVTFEGKDDEEILAGEPTQIRNVSTYAMLMPADEQDPQTSRWLAESVPMTSEELRRHLYNGTFNLIDKDEWEEFIDNGSEQVQTPEDQQKGAIDKRIASVPKGMHDVQLLWLFHTVPMKQTLVSVDGTGAQTEKKVKTFKEYSFVGHFHRRHGKFMSLIRNPRDDGERPYVPVFDGKEPFRHTGDSLAEDVVQYQKIISQLYSLEIKGGVLATTPVTFFEPGSMAGEWLMSNGEVTPGALIPRQRPEEIEATTLGTRPVSLLGLIENQYSQYERETSLGDLQLGLNVPGRTPASTLAQILNQGETLAAMFLDNFRVDLGTVLRLYVQTVQQYMRFGEVIPFDPETAATIRAALGADDADPTVEGMPMRFPVEPIHNQFAFTVTASSDDRTQQNDLDKLTNLWNMVIKDGEVVAQIAAPLASGQLPPQVADLFIQQITRQEKAIELVAKSMRKDGKTFSIDPKKITITAMAEQQAILAQSQQEGQNGPQGIGAGSQPAPPAVPNNSGAMASPVGQPGIPPMPLGDQGGVPQSPPVGAVPGF